MQNSLLLSHLPLNLAYPKTFSPFRESAEPPQAQDVAEALIRKGITPETAWQAVDQARNEAMKTYAFLTSQKPESMKIYHVDYWSIHYPHRLRMIDDPPWNLFFVGELPKDWPTLSIVGTRRPNSYGKEIMRTIVPRILLPEIQIVSGLAFGIDALAHSNACSAGILNFAVLGCGLDSVYPRENEPLARRILECGGGLLSEFPPGAQALPHHFPWRNRIIAGLADLVWIVQGTAKSGSFHTAKFALTQGKTVASTPGDIFSELSQLPHRLLSDGASIVLTNRDLEDHLKAASANLAH